MNEITHTYPAEDMVPVEAPRSHAAEIMALIERVATNPDLPMERFERLLAMKQDIDDRERRLAKEAADEQARREFYDAMAACQEAIPIITKNKDNKQTRSKYADLAALHDAAKPIILRHGFSLSFAPAQTPDGFDGLHLRYRLAHRGGHVEEGVAEVPMSSKGARGGDVMTPIHAFGSAASYGRRYLLLMLFDIATDDDDGNAAGSRDRGAYEPAPPAPTGPNMDRIKPYLAEVAHSHDLEQLKAAYGKARRELRGDDFEEVKHAVNVRKAKLEAARDVD